MLFRSKTQSTVYFDDTGHRTHGSNRASWRSLIRMMKRVCLGGTFNIVHDGHVALLKKAFEVGELVFIGLTTDNMASRSRDVPLQDYETRLQNLNNIISQIAGGRQYFIFPLEEQIGRAHV